MQFMCHRCMTHMHICTRNSTFGCAFVIFIPPNFFNTVALYLTFNDSFVLFFNIYDNSFIRFWVRFFLSFFVVFKKFKKENYCYNWRISSWARKKILDDIIFLEIHISCTWRNSYFSISGSLSPFPLSLFYKFFSFIMLICMKLQTKYQSMNSLVD